MEKFSYFLRKHFLVELLTVTRMLLTSQQCLKKKKKKKKTNVIVHKFQSKKTK